MRVRPHAQQDELEPGPARLHQLALIVLGGLIRAQLAVDPAYARLRPTLEPVEQGLFDQPGVRQLIVG